VVTKVRISVGLQKSGIYPVTFHQQIHLAGMKPSLFTLLLALFVRINAQQKIDLVEINDTYWSTTNLHVTKFNNGDEIRNARTREAWIESLQNGEPAYCAYKNDTSLARKYGLIYNWFAIADPRGLAPDKSRVANNEDYSKLYSYINAGISNYPGKGLVGLRLRDSLGWGVGHPGENYFDFGLQPGGYRNENGEFAGIGMETALWVRDTNSYEVVTLGNAYSSPYALIHGQNPDILFLGDGKRTGCYVRIVLGDEPPSRFKHRPDPKKEEESEIKTAGKNKKKKGG